MSFPVNPSGNISSQGSQPKVVSLPQTKRIIQDIIGKHIKPLSAVKGILQSLTVMAAEA